VNQDDLKSLVMRFIDGLASPDDAAALSRELESNRDARSLYLELAQLHAALSATLAESLARDQTAPHVLHRSGWIWSTVAVAASVVLATYLYRGNESPTNTRRISAEVAANVVELNDCQWVSVDGSVLIGAGIQRGQRIELASGSASVRFKSGALVTLLGPCIFEATSSNGAFLTLGQIKVRADTAAAKGFTVSTRTARVVDVGTEFVAAAAPNGQSRVDVTSGEVYVVLEGAKTQHVLREGDALSVEAGRAQVMVRIERGDSTAAFRFPTIEPPSSNDYADQLNGRASIRVVRGELVTKTAVSSGPAEILLNGRGQPAQDSPRNSVFFDNEISGALLMDLGELVLIEKINTYSWHQAKLAENRVRAVQKYILYGYDGEIPPSIDGSFEAAGWTPIARVNSDDFFRVMQPIDRPAQQACSITGAQGTIGRYRYLLWFVEPTQAIDPRYYNNTFYSEFDVYAKP